MLCLKMLFYSAYGKKVVRRPRESVVVVWPMQVLGLMLFSERHTRNVDVILYTTLVWFSWVLGEFVLFLSMKFDVLNLVL